MHDTTFVRVGRIICGVGSRRRLLGLLAGVPLAGILAHLDDEESAAKRKRHGRRHSHRPGKHKDNRKGKRKGKNDGFGLSDDECAAPFIAAGCTQEQFGTSVRWRCPNEADLHGVDLHGCDLTGAHLLAANLRGANLDNAILDSSDLGGADLTGATLRGASVQNYALLSGVILNDADLTNANLEYANLRDSFLHGTTLSGTDLFFAEFMEAEVDRAIFNNTTCPSGANSSINHPQSCCSQYLPGDAPFSGQCPRATD
jgi:hypothetical protein